MNPVAAMYRERPDTLTTERGAGPTVVLSHGTLMDRTMFAPQFDALSDTYHLSRTILALGLITDGTV